MLMADTMAIFFVIVGFLLAFPGLWLLCRGLWPNAVISARDRCAAGLIRPFIYGVPFAALIVILAAMLGKLGTAGKIGSVGVVCLALMIANCGVSGMVTAIGERLVTDSDEGRAWRATLRGAIVLVLTYPIPFLGWFVILPTSMIIGLGAGLNAIYRHLLTARSGAKEPVPDAVRYSPSPEVGAGR